jgi:hypothetical protein
MKAPWGFGLKDYTEMQGEDTEMHRENKNIFLCDPL